MPWRRGEGGVPESMLSLSEAARAMQGELRGADGQFFRVCTDSRQLRAGDLFIALKGEKFDGATFAPAALADGAAGVVVQRAAAADLEPAIQVDDSRLALGRLAAHWRDRFTLPVAAVTGSNGKTTVKEMLAAILRAWAGDAVLATEGNLNNDIGLPMMLLRLRAEHRCAVLEMGMNHPGELSYLAHLARPDVALVNNAQSAHVGMFASVAEIARAKGEIFEGLSAAGVAVINADDPHAALWQDMNRTRRQLSFGLHAGMLRGRWQAQGYGANLAIDGLGAPLQMTLRVPGEHNARNALAAAACAHALSVPAEAVKAGLESFSGVKGRLQRKAALFGATLLDDTYNANPDSVKAALEVLKTLPGRHVLVLGDMGELGAQSAALHAGIGLAARAAGVERLLALGEQSAEAAKAFGAGAMHFERIEELLAEIENLLAPDVTVLVKGSRFMQMERAVQSFAEAGQ